MTQVYYTRHSGGLTLIVDGHQSTVSNTNPNFEKIVQLLRNKDYEAAISLMNTAETINKQGVCHTVPGCKVFVKNGMVYYYDSRNRKETKLDNTLVDRILADLGKPGGERFASSLMNLLANINSNPIKDIAPELYEWFAAGKAPITSDGCILAYKKVRKDFKDIYTGTMSNEPGKIVRMKQSDVDTNRFNECSRGLHFAALGYLSHYGNSSDGSRIVIVKVNPRHIFAIPRDYNCQKGRASEYFVVGEYLGANREKVEAFNDSFIDEDNYLGAAPAVKYTNQGIRPSLEAIAESHNLVHKGKVKVFGVTDENGSRYEVLPWDTDQPHKVMSFETKSVRVAVKKAIDEIEK